MEREREGQINRQTDRQGVCRETDTRKCSDGVETRFRLKLRRKEISNPV